MPKKINLSMCGGFKRLLNGKYVLESVAIGYPCERADEAMDWMSIVHTLIPTVKRVYPFFSKEVKYRFSMGCVSGHQ